MGTDKFGTIPWYLNVEKIAALLKYGSKQIVKTASTPGIFSILDPVSSAKKVIQDALESYIVKKKVPTLHDLAPDKIESGRMFTIYNDFYCRGISDLKSHDLANIPITKEAKLLKKIYLKKGTRTNVEIKYSPRHLTSGSSFIWLKGHQKLFVVAVIIQTGKNTIEASPLLIGSIGDGVIYDGPDWLEKSSYGQVYISQVDQFRKYNDWMERNQENLKDKPIESIMKSLPEEKIKRYFADIIGELYPNKDWGGEKSDLFTGRLSMEGRQFSAAFIFKGPSKYKDLKCSDLGKNGDQIDRMYSEPCEICVLQHCHTISTAVRAQMKAYSSRVYDLRNHIIIDGIDTYALFKAYGKI